MIKSDEDAIYESDFERLQELLENMLYGSLKTFEGELKKIIRGNIADKQNMDYDLITNNPFHFMKESFQGDLAKVCVKISAKTS